MSRTITITLTEPQFRALGSAVEMAQSDLDDMGGRFASQQIRLLEKAWRKIHSAWHERRQR